MTEDEQRAAVAAEARTWLRTPYHHHAAVRGVGCDCAMFPQAVYVARGMMQPVSLGDYPAQWHLHHDQERYIAAVTAYSVEIDSPPNPGDFVLFKYGKTFSHGAIVLDWPMVIHSYLGRGVEIANADRDGTFQYKTGQPRERRFFSPWGDR